MNWNQHRENFIDDTVVEMINSLLKPLPVDQSQVGIILNDWHQVKYITARILTDLASSLGCIYILLVPDKVDELFRYPIHEMRLSEIIISNENLTDWLVNTLCNNLELSTHKYKLLVYRNDPESILLTDNQQAHLIPIDLMRLNKINDKKVTRLSKRAP